MKNQNRGGCNSGKYLIQTINGEITLYFCFHVVQAVKYNNWYYREERYEYIYSENVNNQEFINYIPIGNLDFVLEFYKKHYNIENIRELHIPSELKTNEFLKRKVWNSNEINISDISSTGVDKVFIKSLDKIKGHTEICDVANITKGDYFISELISIVSEWRGFVYNKKLVDLSCYSGDFFRILDKNTMLNMIDAFKSAPTAYTLDVGVNEKGTFIIECHDFFSCGLYGFADYRILLHMFNSCNKHILKNYAV